MMTGLFLDRLCTMKTIYHLCKFSLCVSLSWDIDVLPLDPNLDWNLYHHDFWVSDLPIQVLGLLSVHNHVSQFFILNLPIYLSIYLPTYHFPTYLPTSLISSVSLEITLIALRYMLMILYFIHGCICNYGKI